MIQNSTYLTQSKQKKISQKMDMYINSLDKKIASAKWKQTLILNYNYMPLEMVKQKIELQTQQYTKRLQDLQIKLTKQTQSQELLQQVDVFTGFAIKLQSKIKEIQQNIQLLNMNISVQKASVQDKKNSLMELLKENVNYSKFIINQKNKKVLQNLRQSKKQNKTIHTYRSDQRMPKTIVQSRVTQKQVSTQYNDTKSYTHVSSANQIYEQCVQAIVKSLRGMNATDDVQSGIYLQIMSRKLPTKAPVFSLKSKTCDVLMDRYKDLRAKKQVKNDEDFSMRLDTFLGLNWKQIMGIILVKDRNAIKLKKLLKSSQFSI